MLFSRFACVVFLTALFATAVISQELDPSAGMAGAQACTECGVIFEIKTITTERELARTLEERAPPTGPFINIPLTAKPGAHPEVGVIGSRQMRKELQEKEYEVVVRFDDGRFTLIMLRDISNLQVGDRVRVRQNRIEPVDLP